MSNPQIIIIGAGIIGLCSGLAMSRRGFKVSVIDKNNIECGKSSPSRVYALNAASVRLLKSLNVWQDLPLNQLSPYRQMQIWDKATRASIDFDCRLNACSELGFIIQEDVLKQSLLKLCQHHQVTLLPLTEACELLENAQEMQIRTKQKGDLSADFILITDGGRSALHHSLNIPKTSWPYHQHALVTTVCNEKSHNNTAYQVFTEEGPLAYLPLIDKHHASIVWSVSSAKAQVLLHLSEQDFNVALNEAFENKLGDSKQISQRHCFELVMRHMQNYHGKHWALLGDAAHTIHPLAGLGLNLGLADLATWIDCFDKYKCFSPKMLGEYQRIRKTAAWEVISLIEGLKTMFLNPLPPVKILRQLGINTLNRLSPLKRLIIQYAAG